MVEKRVKKFGQGPPPPLFGQCPKEIDFFYGRGSLRMEPKRCPSPPGAAGREKRWWGPKGLTELWHKPKGCFSEKQGGLCHGGIRTT